MSRLPTRSIRIIATLVGLYGVLFGPAWLTLLVILLLSLRFRSWEALFLGMSMDFIWLPNVSLFPMLPLFTIASFIIVWGLEPLRSELMLS